MVLDRILYIIVKIKIIAKFYLLYINSIGQVQIF